MANLTIVVPNPLIPTFVQLAEAWMTAQVPPVDFSAMANDEKVRRWTVGAWFKVQYISRKERQAENTREVTYRAGVATDVAVAVTDAGGII